MSKQILRSNRQALSGENLLQLDPRPDNVGVLEEEQLDGEHSHVFPSGHRVSINLDGQNIEVSDIHGELQVQISITEKGPQISLNGGELNLESPERIAMNCSSFRVNTEGDTEIFAKGKVKIDAREETRISCDQDVFVRGQVIWLN